MTQQGYESMYMDLQSLQSQPLTLCDLSEPSSTWANSGTSPLHAVWHRVGFPLQRNRSHNLWFPPNPHTCQGRRGHDAKCDLAG